jgi:soluble lytic murein transglycosylase-like protein
VSLPPLRRQSGAIPLLEGRALPQPLRPTPSAEMPAGGAAAASLAARLERLGAELSATADRAAAEEAWNAGTVAGEANPGAQMQGGGVLYRTAFNRAAVDASARRLEIRTREELARAFEANPADPEAFAAAAQSWREQTRQGLPEHVAAIFAQRFDAIALPYANQARENLRRRVADDAVSTYNAALPGRVADLERAASQALADPAAARAMRQIEDQAVAEAVALGPREAFEAGGRRFPADPSRTGALTAAQVTEQIQKVERARTDAAVMAAWRAAGGGLQWIVDFERNGATPGFSPFAQRQAAQGRALGTVDAFAARVPEAWRPIAEQAARENGLPPALLLALLGVESAGNAQARSPAGAVGPAQILPSTARDPGIPGLEPLPEAALTDPARAIPWAARYLAGLRERFGGDIGKALAAYNAGMRRVERAEREGADLPAETRNYLATLMPAAAGAGGALPSAETARIAARLRATHAAETQAAAAGQAAQRAELERQIAENLAAIGVNGRPVHVLSEAQLAAAGLDPARVLERERMRAEAYAADQTARLTVSPQALQDLAASFAPGTDNFRADPEAATRLLAMLRQRGVQIANVELAERIRDLSTEAQATGQRRSITAEEGAAAGLTPEKVAEINRDLALAGDTGAIRREAAGLPEAEREAFLARFPLTGPEAHRNAQRVRATAEAFAERDRAVAQDAAAYAMAGSPILRELGGRIAAGDWNALGPFIRQMRAEQELLGIAQAARRDLPKPFVEALYQRIANSPDADAAWAALASLTEAAGLPAVQRIVREWRPEGERQDDRRRAIVVAAALRGQDDETARLVLRGAFVLRDNPMPASTRQTVQEAVDRHVRGALERQPGVRADITAAAVAAAAATAIGEGRMARPASAGDFGAVLERMAPVTTYAGERTMLPPGMRERAFHDLLAALPPERLDGAEAQDGRPITPAMLARGDFILRAVAPGRYMLRLGTHVVPDARRPGEAFILDLNGAQPAPAAAARPAGESDRRRASPRSLVRPIEGWEDEP